MNAISSGVCCEHHASLLTCPCRQQDGQTPIFCAGEATVVEALVKCGADVFVMAKARKLQLV